MSRQSFKNAPRFFFPRAGVRTVFKFMQSEDIFRWIPARPHARINTAVVKNTKRNKIKRYESNHNRNQKYQSKHQLCSRKQKNLSTNEKQAKKQALSQLIVPDRRFEASLRHPRDALDGDLANSVLETGQSRVHHVLLLLLLLYHTLHNLGTVRHQRGLMLSRLHNLETPTRAHVIPTSQSGDTNEGSCYPDFTIWGHQRGLMLSRLHNLGTPCSPAADVCMTCQ